ncbi:MAG: hypothetical protein IKG47_04285 [Oscillospiraceae bacterium]|nr:hypothetical protein [Oscillospiraceae bacterium]
MNAALKNAVVNMTSYQSQYLEHCAIDSISDSDFCDSCCRKDAECISCDRVTSN